MAQDVALWGVAYTDVPEVRVPKQGGGMAAFHDVSDTTASAEDVAQGKLFHAADGTLTEGTASGGGGGTPKLGVLRPDAELWKSWTYDGWIVADEGVTIPSYSTSLQTLKAKSTLEVVSLDMANYDYMFCARGLAYPTYNITGVSAGKQRFCVTGQVVTMDMFQAGALHEEYAGGTIVAPATTASASNRSIILCSSWASGSAISATTTGYGFFVGSDSASLSGSNLTISSPSFYVRGGSSSFNSSWWSKTTDARYQYIIELYRVPASNMSVYGYDRKSLAMHAINCAQSDDKTLT